MKNKPFQTYWHLAFSWSKYVKDLQKKGLITERQAHNWGNPCTPTSFKVFNTKFLGE